MPNTEPDRTLVRVAVGVICDPQSRVLIALRSADKHQGGLWEFPGGKIEPGESPIEALARELHEELGIVVRSATPLIQIPFRYPDKTVLLDVWSVADFDGLPVGKEGQPIRWVTRDRLHDYAFPAANRPILNALRLPPLAAVTGAFSSPLQLTERLSGALSRGARLVVLRPFDHDSQGWSVPIQQARAICEASGAILVLSSSIGCVNKEEGAGANVGIHLNARDLMSLSERPIQVGRWLGASCHNESELQQAAAIGVDYAFLSPVMPTRSHPGQPSMGWQRFADCVRGAPFPVYALGGLGRGDLVQARACGAQGVAGLSDFWC